MPIVSIIIPTHNRAKYAAVTLMGLLDLSSEIEVVVCDTSVDDNITPLIGAYAERSSLKFIRPQKAMSVVDNFNVALEVASGDFLVFIGDDDFVGLEILSVAKWAQAEDVDAIKFSFPALYYWPDFLHKSQANKIAGTLQLSKFSGDISIINPRLALDNALGNFGGGVMEMPRAYAGMVSAKLVKEICARYGSLFGGVSPDIFSAALISATSHKCAKIDFPVIIPGASGESTAGQSANGKHIGGLRDNPHIGAFQNLHWDDRVPEFYSVPTVWAYSLLKAAEVMAIPPNKINFSSLYLKCALYHRQFLSQNIAAIQVAGKRMGWFKLSIDLFPAFLRECKWVLGKLFDRFKRKINLSNGSLTIAGLENINTANAALMDFSKKNNRQIIFNMRDTH